MRRPAFASLGFLWVGLISVFALFSFRERSASSFCIARVNAQRGVGGKANEGILLFLFFASSSLFYQAVRMLPQAPGPDGPNTKVSKQCFQLQQNKAAESRLSYLLLRAPCNRNIFPLASTK